MTLVFVSKWVLLFNIQQDSKVLPIKPSSQLSDTQEMYAHGNKAQKNTMIFKAGRSTWAFLLLCASTMVQQQVT